MDCKLQTELLQEYAVENGIPLPPSVTHSEVRKAVIEWMIQKAGLQVWNERVLASIKVPTWAERGEQYLANLLQSIPGVRKVQPIHFYRVKSLEGPGSSWWTAKFDVAMPWGTTHLQIKVPRIP